ncbi:MAG: antibiotic biosynthesis monooxygenase [Pseudomonadota bacterium]
MVVYCVKIYVKKENIGSFQQAIMENHQATRLEKGNIRYDVLQNATDPGQFFLYEVYESEQAVDEHKKTAHYLKWRDTVASWMEKPREGVMHKIIAPTPRSQW